MTNAQYRVILIIVAMVLTFLVVWCKVSEKARINYNLQYHSEIK
ncbi:hypothetical protein [Mucilaginibacter glaciei]|nr:hypothetical protein [Mucilaginibacter glaciei]